MKNKEKEMKRKEKKEYKVENKKDGMSSISKKRIDNYKKKK
jgi:hypothetical protein